MRLSRLRYVTTSCRGGRVVMARHQLPVLAPSLHLLGPAVQTDAAQERHGSQEHGRRTVHTGQNGNSNNGNNEASANVRNEENVSREEVLHAAAALTKSLYRTCLRSVRVIRFGNEFDEKEFQQREEDFANPKAGGGGILSMAPPPNREDELNSRFEYYQAYTREYFTQESDCLDDNPLTQRDIDRYLYYVRKGEKDRKWLLGDMMFKDPYKETTIHERIHQFEMLARRHLGHEIQDQSKTDGGLGPVGATKKDAVVEDDGYFDDIQDDEPQWFKNKFPHLK